MRLTLPLFLLFSLVVGCTKNSTPAARKDQLRFPLFTEPASWDTTVAQDPASQEILFTLMEGLVKHERYGKIVPALAERWEVSPDGKQVRFWLRSAKWSDGRDVHAEDFVFAWQRLLDPKNTNPYSARLFAIDKAEDFHTGKVTNFAEVGVKAPDPSKLELTLAHPDGALLETMTELAMAPQRADLVTGVTDAFSAPDKLRTTGPFLVKKWEKGVSLQLVANPNYYSRHPMIPSLTIAFYRDLAVAASKYDKGELDILMPVPTGENEKWKQSPDFEVVAMLKAQSAAPLVSTPQYEKVGVLAKPYLENFPVDIYGHPMFASARFRQEQENPSEQ